MMKRSFRDRWADELESDRHTQGRLRLKDASGCECCLGVALPLIGVEPDGQDEDGDFTFGVDHFGEPVAGMPSFAHLTAMGLTFDQAEDLAQQNDTGASFREIAVQLRAMTVED